VSKKESALKGKDFRKLASLKKCSFCGGELEKGYIHGNIYWDKKIRKFWAGVLVSDEIIQQTHPWDWHLSYSSALKCKDCRIIVLDYGKGKEREKQ
jgi:hypothetical protein